MKCDSIVFFLLVQACAPFEVGPKSSTSSSHVFLKLRAHPNLVKALGFCCYWQFVTCIDVLCRTCMWWISKFVGVVLSIKPLFEEIYYKGDYDFNNSTTISPRAMQSKALKL